MTLQKPYQGCIDGITLTARSPVPVQCGIVGSPAPGEWQVFAVATSARAAWRLARVRALWTRTRDVAIKTKDPHMADAAARVLKTLTIIPVSPVES